MLLQLSLVSGIGKASLVPVAPDLINQRKERHARTSAAVPQLAATESCSWAIDVPQALWLTRDVSVALLRLPPWKELVARAYTPGSQSMLLYSESSQALGRLVGPSQVSVILNPLLPPLPLS